jgi:hypothetical protein
MEAPRFAGNEGSGLLRPPTVNYDDHSYPPSMGSLSISQNTNTSRSSKLDERGRNPSKDSPADRKSDRRARSRSSRSCSPGEQPAAKGAEGVQNVEGIPESDLEEFIRLRNVYINVIKIAQIADELRSKKNGNLRQTFQPSIDMIIKGGEDIRRGVRDHPIRQKLKDAEHDPVDAAKALVEAEAMCS